MQDSQWLGCLLLLEPIFSLDAASESTSATPEAGAAASWWHFRSSATAEARDAPRCPPHPVGASTPRGASGPFTKRLALLDLFESGIGTGGR